MQVNCRAARIDGLYSILGIRTQTTTAQFLHSVSERGSVFATSLAIKLPMTFRPESLQHDLKIAERFDFQQHPLNYHDGSWKAINLIYPGGEIHYAHRGADGMGEGEPIATDVLKSCPYFTHIFEHLEARGVKVLMARLSALPAGGKIHVHYDRTESVDFDMWRVHIPIVTHSKVKFYLGYVRRRWQEGEAWVGDFTFPHWVYNESPVNRVHMIIDCKPSDRMREMLPAGHMTPKALARRAWLRGIHKQLAWYQYKWAGVDRHGRRDTPKSAA